MKEMANVCVPCRHLDDVVATEDATRVASITVFPDGALQLRGKHTEDDQYIPSARCSVPDGATMSHFHSQREKCSSAGINKRWPFFMFSSKK